MTYDDPRYQNPVMFSITLEMLKGISDEIREIFFKQYEKEIVAIHSDHGYWRPKDAGYSDNVGDAQIHGLRAAYEKTASCGPEKQVEFRLLPDLPIPTL